MIQGLEWVTMRYMNDLHPMVFGGILLAWTAALPCIGCKPAHEPEYPYGVRPVETELAQPTEEAPPPSMEELREILDSQEKPPEKGGEGLATADLPAPDSASKQGEGEKSADESDAAVIAAGQAAKSAKKEPPKTSPEVGSDAPSEDAAAEEAPIVRPARTRFHDFRGEWLRGKSAEGSQAWRFERTGIFDCREDRADGVRVERTGTFRVQESESRITLSFNEWKHTPDPSGKVLRKLSTGHSSAVVYAIEEGSMKIDGVPLSSRPVSDSTESP